MLFSGMKRAFEVKTAYSLMRKQPILSDEKTIISLVSFKCYLRI